MAAPRSQLPASPFAMAQTRAMLDQAARDGRLDEVRIALTRLLDRISLVPLDYGEDRDALPTMGMIPRIAFVNPVVARFAVNEDLKMVWIQSIRLYPDLESGGA